MICLAYYRDGRYDALRSKREAYKSLGLAVGAAKRILRDSDKNDEINIHESTSLLYCTQDNRLGTVAWNISGDALQFTKTKPSNCGGKYNAYQRYDLS